MQKWKRIFSDARLTISIFLLIIFTFGTLFAPFLIHYEPTEFHLLHKYEGPSSKFWFGTDKYGRDTYSRILLGGRYTLALGLLSTILGLIVGVPLGMSSGYWGGNVDEIIMRINDSLMAIPSLLLALLVVSMLGSSLVNASLAIAFVFAPRIARVVRSSTIDIKNEMFVQAARARGESDFYIIFREILPNAWPTIIVEATYRAGFAIFTGASLSFLGLGVQPPHPEWGLMIRQARTQIFLSPWALVFPSIMIVLVILAFNFLGDGINNLIVDRRRS